MSELKRMLEAQAELDKRIREERDLQWPTKSRQISSLCTAISNETEELRDLTDWKFWADNIELDRAKAKEELIDILHFWLSIANLLGMDAGEIEDVYFGKNEVNHERQDEGY